MRISTKSIQLQWLADVYRRQAEMARVQKQVSSGRRINTAADDPGGAGQLVSLQQGLARLAAYQANGEAARRRLALEEHALAGVQDALARMRELAIEAGGGIQTSETRRAMAAEVRELLAGLVDRANSQDGEGHHLFAGNASQVLPVTLHDGHASYNGDDGTRLQRIGDNRSVREADPGSEVFFRIRSGNGLFAVAADGMNQGSAFLQNATIDDSGAWIADAYTLAFTGSDGWNITDSQGATVASGSFRPGDTLHFRGAAITLDGVPAAGDRFSIVPSANTSLFAIAERLASALEAGSGDPRSRAGFQTALNSALLDLGQAELHLEGIRGSVGSRLATIDEQGAGNEELLLQLQASFSSLGDVDYPKAVSDLQSQLLGLEAAHRVFAQTRGLSLFDLL